MIWWALLLFFAGMILIVAEFVVPGGICGATGLLLLVVSGVLGVQAYPEFGLAIVIGEAIGAFICILIGFFLLARTGLGRALRLDKSQRVEDGYVNETGNTELLGAHGTVYSALRPAGAIVIGGKRLDAVSNGSFIDKDVPVRVIEVHGNRVVVEALD